MNCLGSRCVVNTSESNVLIWEYRSSCLSGATPILNPAPSQIHSLPLEMSFFPQKAMGWSRTTENKQLTEGKKEKTIKHNKMKPCLALKT